MRSRFVCCCVAPRYADADNVAGWLAGRAVGGGWVVGSLHGSLAAAWAAWLGGWLYGWCIFCPSRRSLCRSVGWLGGWVCWRRWVFVSHLG